MSIIYFIPYDERQQQYDLIHQIGLAIFGTDEAASFAESFVPHEGQVPEPKAQNFASFLITKTKCLWAVYSDDSRENVVGFILISDMPHNNAIGFGLNPSYARKGLMKKAWQEIIAFNECIQYPINAYTSKNNLPVNSFLKNIGFQFVGNMDFMGELSTHYRFNT